MKSESQLISLMYFFTVHIHLRQQISISAANRECWLLWHIQRVVTHFFKDHFSNNDFLEVRVTLRVKLGFYGRS